MKFSHSIATWFVATNIVLLWCGLVNAIDTIKTNPSVPVTSPSKTISIEELSPTQLLELGNQAARQEKHRTAVSYFNRAIQGYRQNKDATGTINGSLNKVRSLKALGQYKQSQNLLKRLAPEIERVDTESKSRYYKAVGTTQTVFGNYEAAETALKEALEATDDMQLRASILIDLGNIFIKEDPSKAVALFDEAIELSTDKKLRFAAYTNKIKPLYDLKKVDKSTEALKISQRYRYEGSFIETIGHKLWLGNRIKKELVESSDLDRLKTLAIAKNTSNQTRAYAYGALASFYENKANYNLAASYVQKAINIAVMLDMPQLSYKWHHLAARIADKTGNRTLSLENYRLALSDLQKVRRDLVSYSSEIRYNFRDEIEPIYRNYIELLTRNGNPSQKDLVEVRQTLESLQLAELENFFRQACLDAKPKQIDNLDSTAAIIYPVILDEKIVSVTAVGNSPLIYQEYKIDKHQVDKTIDSFLIHSNPSGSNKRRIEYGQQIHDWLISQNSQNFSSNNIQTLVFVLDGKLKNVPLATITNNGNYLIEDYTVAIAPGLQLLEGRGDGAKLEAIVGGLSKANEGFSALPGVEKEVARIENIVDSEVLLDEQFTQSNLEKKLAQSSSSPFLHLATHGQFSSKKEDTFLKTFDGKINVDEIGEVLRVREETPKLVPINSLILSACKTAAGDDRAALGLAGFAVKSGARSTIGSLWSVNDVATQILFDEFYTRLSDDTTTALKLRQAQLAMLDTDSYSHPYYWGAFEFVGDWTINATN